MKSIAKQHLIVVIMLCFSFSMANAQVQDWTKYYSTNANQFKITNVIQTADSNFLFCVNNFKAPNHTENKVLFFKIDKSGNEIWQKEVSSDSTIALKVLVAEEGGYLILAERNGLLKMIKTDKDGVFSWEKNKEEFKPNGTIYFGIDGAAISYGSDDGYIIAGKDTANLLRVEKVDTAGTEEWAKTYEAINFVNAVTPALDGGYLVTASLYDANTSKLFTTLQKITASGDSVWRTLFHHPQHFYGSLGLKTVNASDSSFITISEAAAPGLSFAVAKTSNNGSSTWQKEVPHTICPWVSDIQPSTTHDAFIIGTGWDSTTWDDSNIILLNVDDQGTFTVKADHAVNLDSNFTSNRAGEGTVTMSGGYAIPAFSYHNIARNVDSVGVIIMSDSGDVSTYVPSISSTGNFTLFPNPFSDYTLLNVSGKPHDQLQLSIFDLQGKQVKTMTVNNSNIIRIDKEDLPNGIYLYQLRNSQQLLHTGKLIIQ